MKDEQPRRGFLRRAFIARILACVVILQGVGSAVSHERDGLFGFGSQTAGYVEAGLCGSGAVGDQGAPAPHHDHSQCCILCSSSADDGLILFAAALFDIVVFSTPDSVAVGWRFLDEVVAPASGLSSSWSSRAPPFFF
jgi:hypothetical protein